MAARKEVGKPSRNEVFTRIQLFPRSEKSESELNWLIKPGSSRFDK
jgi:hypothetical protein